MATFETGQTTDNTPTPLHMFGLGDGDAVERYVHWTTYTSKTEVASGEGTFLFANNPGEAPILKASSGTTTFNGYGVAPTVTAAVSGSDCQILATGLAGKTITWKLQIS